MAAVNNIDTKLKPLKKMERRTFAKDWYIDFIQPRITITRGEEGEGVACYGDLPEHTYRTYFFIISNSERCTDETLEQVLDDLKENGFCNEKLDDSFVAGTDVFQILVDTREISSFEKALQRTSLRVPVHIDMIYTGDKSNSCEAFDDLCVIESECAPDWIQYIDM